MYEKSYDPLEDRWQMLLVDGSPRQYHHATFEDARKNALAYLNEHIQFCHQIHERLWRAQTYEDYERTIRAFMYES